MVDPANVDNVTSVAPTLVTVAAAPVYPLVTSYFYPNFSKIGPSPCNINLSPGV